MSDTIPARTLEIPFDASRIADLRVGMLGWAHFTDEGEPVRRRIFISRVKDDGTVTIQRTMEEEMPRTYDISNKADEAKYNGCRLFDGDGNEIVHVVRFNSDTGEVIRLAHDGTNFVLTAEEDAVQRITQKYKLPLALKWPAGKESPPTYRPYSIENT